LPFWAVLSASLLLFPAWGLMVWVQAPVSLLVQVPVSVTVLLEASVPVLLLV